jgi:hypothetical protein
MHRVQIVLAGALTLLAIAIGVTLLQAPTSIARTNGTPLKERLVLTGASATFCQAHELLPRDTSAIRISLSAFTGPHVNVVVTSRGHLVTNGQRDSGWTSRVVTVPVKPMPYTVHEATVCLSFLLHNETVTLFGSATSRAIATHMGARILSGRMSIEYLHPGMRSWASLAISIARHMGLGRAIAGTWVVLLVLSLLAAVIVITSGLILEEVDE